MTSPIPNRFRIAGPLLTAFLLTGCSSGGSGDMGAMFSVFRNIISGGGQTMTPPITLEQAASVPNASIAAHIGGGGEQMLILSANNGGEQTWIGTGNVALVTRDGRLVQTGGLARDMPRYNSNGYNAPLPRMLGATVKTNWVADFTTKNLYSVSITCNAQAVREEMVTILGKGIRTMRVDETCSASQLNWTYNNQYWISPVSGIVWQSVQRFSDEMEPMTIIVLRPLGAT
jgi:hypothetical protein